MNCFVGEKIWEICTPVFPIHNKMLYIYLHFHQTYIISYNVFSSYIQVKHFIFAGNIRSKISQVYVCHKQLKYVTCESMWSDIISFQLFTNNKNSFSWFSKCSWDEKLEFWYLDKAATVVTVHVFVDRTTPRFL